MSFSAQDKDKLIGRKKKRADTVHKEIKSFFFVQEKYTDFDNKKIY